jgi:AmmeMemoRadiSam system protein A
MTLSPESGRHLIDLAARAVAAGLSGPMPAPDSSGWTPELVAPRATFVTLTTEADGLRGCRGTLEPCRPLGADVWYNAVASAFDDPRFAPITAAEFAALEIEISVLGPLVAVDVASESALVERLVPGRDGVVLCLGRQRATFLPKVWEQLPSATDFLGELKRKAGLPRRFWSTEIEIFLYHTETVAGRASIVPPVPA